MGRQGTGDRVIQEPGYRYSQGQATGVAKERRPGTGLDRTEINVGLEQETRLARTGIRVRQRQETCCAKDRRKGGPGTGNRVSQGTGTRVDRNRENGWTGTRNRVD